MHPEKDPIRTQMIEQRRLLLPEEVQIRSNQLRQRLFDTDLYRQATCISTYVSVKNEIDTHQIIQDALHSGKRVAVPATRKQRVLVHLEIHALTDLHPAPFGLLEPSGPNHLEISPDTFNLILVPGLAFDLQGNRIGFGAGYYDRFLAHTPAPKIALAYDFQILDQLPTDPHDIPLNMLLTESRTLHCHRTQP